MEARGKRAAFSEVRWARSVRPRRRQLPQGPSVCDKIAASSDCSRPVNDYVHIEAADLCRPNARFTQERQGYQVLTPFGKLGYSQDLGFRQRVSPTTQRTGLSSPGAGGRHASDSRRATYELRSLLTTGTVAGGRAGQVRAELPVEQRPCEPQRALQCERVTGEPQVEVEAERRSFHRLEDAQVDRDRVADNLVEEVLAEFDRAFP